MGSTKKTKLCILTTISKTMDWFIVDSACYLNQNNFEITLISNMDQDFIDRNSDYAKCISLNIQRGVAFSDFFKTIFKLKKIFKECDFDIVQYTTPNISLYAGIAAKLAKVPVRLYCQWGIRYISMTGLSRHLFKFLEKITCSLATDIREVSQLNRELAIQEKLCGGEKISVIGDGGTIGVDLIEYDLNKKNEYRASIREKYGISGDVFVFGYVGRINSDKGINELVTAFREHAHNFDTSYLLLVGMLDVSNKITEENMRWANSHPNVIMTGNVPANEICKYMSALDILVHPTYREGFGKVLQEAMAMETPVITTDIPGPSEVIEKDVSGILVPVRDSAALLSAMTGLYHDAETRKTLALNGRKRVEEKFARPIMLNNILTDMQNLAGRGAKS